MKSVREFESASPIRKISILHRLYQNYLAGPLAEMGLARGTLPFLMVVLSQEDIIQEDISRALSIDRAATARALQNLEQDGFVKRVADPDDKRKKHIHSTKQTKLLQKKIMSLLNQQRQILFSGFSELEQEQFLNSLDRMIKNIHTNEDRKEDIAE